MHPVGILQLQFDEMLAAHSLPELVVDEDDLEVPVVLIVVGLVDLEPWQIGETGLSLFFFRLFLFLGCLGACHGLVFCLYFRMDDLGLLPSFFLPRFAPYKL